MARIYPYHTCPVSLNHLKSEDKFTKKLGLKPLLSADGFPNAVFVWNDRTIDTVYRGDDIHQAWQQFFSEYQIQEYRVFDQNSRERTVTAEISVIAKLDTAADVYPLVTSPYAVARNLLPGTLR